MRVLTARKNRLYWNGVPAGKKDFEKGDLVSLGSGVVFRISLVEKPEHIVDERLYTMVWRPCHPNVVLGLVAVQPQEKEDEA